MNIFYNVKIVWSSSLTLVVRCVTTKLPQSTHDDRFFNPINRTHRKLEPIPCCEFQNRVNLVVRECCAMEKPRKKKNKQARNQAPYPKDFLEPWKLSDVVLVVEEQRFHVHRSTLAFWSPVFERMFTSDFREKNSDEIPLPGKKASQVKELLQIMYPSLEEKVITSNNCYFLLDLAREYQIESITRKCQDFLVSAVKTRKENDVIAVLIVGQSFELEPLVESCVYEARRLSLKELRHHTKRDEIDPDNYLLIAEGIIERLEEQYKEVKQVKASCSRLLLDSSRCLYNHAKMKGDIRTDLYDHADYYQVRRFPFMRAEYFSTTDEYLDALEGDNSEHECNSGYLGICPGLSEVAKHLKELKSTLETLPQTETLPS